MFARSSRPDVRNPLLSLPGLVDAFATLPPEAVRALDVFLDVLASNARSKAETCWQKHKPPMAAYWKAIAVYARHLRLAVRTARQGRDLV
jgi:hypothetical protein